MSRIFRVSGHLIKNGIWPRIKPNFYGEIVLESDNFFGYCNELGDRKKYSNQHFLVGTITKNRKNVCSAAFYRLSNKFEQGPLLFVVPDLSQPDNASWAIMNPFGLFQFQGKATIKYEESPYSSAIESEIKHNFEQLNRFINCNGEFLAQLDRCKEYTAHTVI